MTKNTALIAIGASLALACLGSCTIETPEQAKLQTHDCVHPESKADKEFCAHKKFTAPVGPEKLPTDQKGWKF